MSKPVNSCNEASKLVPQQQYEHDIAVVTSDPVVAVPVDPSPQHATIVKRLTCHLSLCGDTNIRVHRIGKRNVYICLCGNHKLDLRQVLFSTSPETHITIIMIKLCGDIHLIVPPNTFVSTCAIMLCGDKRIEAQDSGGDESSYDVKLTIVKLCGDVIVTNDDQDDE